MISVIIQCFSRQEHLNITLPRWLGQEGIEHEVVLAVGPSIKTPVNAKLRLLPIESLTYNHNWNELAKEAKGDILLIAQCDIEVNSPVLIKTMLETWRPGRIVTEKFFKDGRRDAGVHCQCMMVSKEDYMAVGGFCELFDDPKTAAHEDTDLMASLIERGLNIYPIELDDEYASCHIDHPKPNYQTDPVMLSRLAEGNKIYNSRHKLPYVAMYAKQVARILTEKVKYAYR